MSTIQFEPLIETQKQCASPLSNPTFNRDTVPIMSYTSQMRTRTPNKSCTEPSTPYLSWDQDRSKYCCSSDLQDADIALDKIEYSIRRQLENSCNEQIYNKYKSSIDYFIKSYMTIYENKHRSSVSPDELAGALAIKKAELIELSKYYEEHHESCSENAEDLGEDDEALMENLRLAQENGPNRRGSNFFDRQGGRFSHKKSKKQTNIRKYRRSAKLYKH